MINNHLCDKDFMDTNFINWELKWTIKDEFISNAQVIKKVYKVMSYNQRVIYKWYCYANIHTNLYQKNKIWDYLNGDIGYKECVCALNSNGNNYKEKTEK